MLLSVNVIVMVVYCFRFLIVFVIIGDLFIVELVMYVRISLVFVCWCGVGKKFMGEIWIFFVIM